MYVHCSDYAYCYQVISQYMYLALVNCRTSPDLHVVPIFVACVG